MTQSGAARAANEPPHSRPFTNLLCGCSIPKNKARVDDIALAARWAFFVGNPSDAPVSGRVGLDRLSRSERDLLTMLALIAEKKAGVRYLGDTWADTTTALGRLMLALKPHQRREA